MNIPTIGKFMIGRRAAILDICNTKNSIWVGLLFVVSAGFARDYDGEDLLHDPWYLLISMVASFVSATGLFFVLVVIGLIRKQSGLINFGLYRKFLSLFAFGSLVILFMDRTKETPSTGEFNGVVRTSLWGCGLSSIAVWFLVLPSTQLKKIRRYHAERMLYAGEIRDAIRLVSTKQRTDFPLFWGVLRRIFLAEKVPNLFGVIGVLNSEATTADCVRGSFVDKLIRFYRMGPVRMETPRLFEMQPLSNVQLESPMIEYGICESDVYAFDEQGNDDIQDGTVGERALLDSAEDPVRIDLVQQLQEISDRYDARTGGSL